MNQPVEEPCYICKGDPQIKPFCSRCGDDRALVVTATVYRILEKRGADMRFYKMNQQLRQRR